MRTEKGFTLLEVMIALAILFSALVVLIGTTTANVEASNRAKMLTIATSLARVKMLELEEVLLKDGFQETSQDDDGDFGEEGYPKMIWEAQIEKIELPQAGDVQNAAGNAAEAASGTTGGESALDQAKMGMVMTQFETVKGILEAAIRKVTLTLKWKIGKKEESLVLAAYFTDPKAVDTVGNALSALLTGTEPPEEGTPPPTPEKPAPRRGIVQ